MSMTTAFTADEWQKAASDTFVPLVIAETDESFSGVISTVQLDSRISVSHIKHPRAHVMRTAEGVKEADDNSLYFSLNLGQNIEVIQDGRSAVLRDGAGAFYISSKPYDIVIPETTDQIVVQADRGQVDVRPHIVENALARPVNATAELALLRSYFLGLTRKDFTALYAARDVLSQAALDLTAYAIQALAGEPSSTHMSTTSLFEGMMASIRVNATDPAFGVDALAKQFYVSRRLVYLAFSAAGITPADAIRAERFRVARILLSYPGISVSETAWRCGIPDASYFSKVFKAEHGVTPLQWHQQRS